MAMAMVARINGETIVGSEDSALADGLKAGMQAAEIKRLEDENQMLRELLIEAKERIELYAWELEKKRLQNMELKRQLDRRRSGIYRRMIERLTRA